MGWGGKEGRLELRPFLLKFEETVKQRKKQIMMWIWGRTKSKF